MEPVRTVAYFSMEIGLEAGMPTYAGGLGVLAGDSLRSAADLGVPMVAVTLLHRQGYFRQRLDERGRQAEEPESWDPAVFARPEPARVSVEIAGRAVQVAAWRYVVRGVGGFGVPVYLLDTNLPENDEHDRGITGQLYGGDAEYRLRQEVVLGVGGVRLLDALGHTGVRRYHMNEGHAALLALELLARLRRASPEEEPKLLVDAVRRRCVFTTHTPVPAGHDTFPLDLARRVLGRELFDPDAPAPIGGCGVWEGMLNLTHLGLSMSRYVNGVAKRHGEVSRRLFREHEIDSITNGVHVSSWASPPFRTLFDASMRGWRQDNFLLRHAVAIPTGLIAAAHAEAKARLLATIRERTGRAWDPEALTIGFARRATAYKRLDLLLSDTSRLEAIARRHGPLQIVLAGKAHPRDAQGKALIERAIEASRRIADPVRMVYLENYGMELAGLLTSGVDLWLNTPLPPMEASGTSGMKAAVNAVPSLSVLDGWWVEGCIEGVTGWSIGVDHDGAPGGEHGDAASLYEKLDDIIVPMFYRDRDQYLRVMRQALALNGSFFNTQRMMQEYVTKAYFD